MVESSTSSTPQRVDSSASVSSSATSTTSNTAQQSQTPSSLITALPTEEALQILLSPDGYYKYLQIAKPTPDAMGLKYQAAMSAGGGDVNEGKGTEIDLDQVKKNYRRLSLKHHPDRKTGDAECFRMLNRAKIVLSNNKLRREYDLVGLDLDDDVDDPDHHHEEGASSSTTASGTKENGESNKEEEKDSGGSSKTETVMGHLASATLAAVLQVVVRTGLMGAVSSIISRYTILTVIAIGMLTFLTYKLYQTVKTTLGPGVKLTFASLRNAISPLVIAFGIFCMYRGRSFVVDTSSTTSDNAVVGDSTTANAETIPTYLDWSWTFWLGETIVMTSFITNSLEKTPRPVLFICIVLSLLLSLWLRGRFWRYATLLGFEGIIALLVVLAFPIMEMILESIVEEKMRKVGEKIRKATRFEDEGNVEEEEGTEVADVDLMSKDVYVHS